MNSRGKTIVLSAHNLYHIEYVCHRVAILKNGKICVCDTIDSIRQKLGQREYEVIFKADVDLNYTKQGDNYIFRTTDVSQIAVLLQKISDRNWALIDLSVKQSALEDMYVKLMDEAPAYSIAGASEN
jgi:ABC-2 type transport system ATP-binding protein